MGQFALLVVFIGLSRWLFRAALVYRPDRVNELMALDEREALSDRPLLVRSLVVLALVTVAFALHGLLHLEPSVVALLGAGLLLLLARRDPEPFLREIEWPTLLFFVGLFIMVGALIKTAVIDQLAEAVAAATGGSLWVASMLLLWVSGLLSAIVDNIPYVATMAPVTATLVQDLQGDGDATVLWWSLALGADLGGNATAIGASANVVILGLAQRAGQPISFLEFTQVRRRGRGRHHVALCAVPVAALLRLWLGCRGSLYTPSDRLPRLSTVDAQGGGDGRRDRLSMPALRLHLAANLTGDLTARAALDRTSGKVAPCGVLVDHARQAVPREAAMGDPQRLDDTEQLEILGLLEAATTEGSAVRAARALAELMGHLHALGQRIAAELPDQDRDRTPAG